MARRSFSGGTRMTKEWGGISGSRQTFTADGTALVGSLAPARPSTVLRILGEYTVHPTAAVAAGDAAVISVGIGVVSSDAAAVGSTAMPEPFGDQAFPWLYWGSHAFSFPSTTQDPSHLAGSGRFSIDVKSMRRLKTRESLVWVADYFDFSGQPPLTLVGSALRVLLAS